jgi:predicted TIM-barrel fold metal-dependent hydrolase
LASSARAIGGAKRLPHPDSKYPHAVDSFLALPGVSDESKRRILWKNALSLYGLDSSAAIR